MQTNKVISHSVSAFALLSVSALVLVLVLVSQDEPLEESGVLGLPDEAGPHHDGLEDLALDGP